MHSCPRGEYPKRMIFEDLPNAFTLLHQWRLKYLYTSALHWLEEFWPLTFSVDPTYDLSIVFPNLGSTDVRGLAHCSEIS
ncbi:MAG: hypothetical protein RLZZ262_1251 [Bacteroidota bacterium]|jgi:hypothetical protein